MAATEGAGPAWQRTNGVRARLAAGPLALGPTRGEEWCWAKVMLRGSGQKKEMDWAARESRPQAENRERERFSFFFSLSFVSKPFSISNLNQFWDLQKYSKQKYKCTSMYA